MLVKKVSSMTPWQLVNARNSSIAKQYLKRAVLEFAEMEGVSPDRVSTTAMFWDGRYANAIICISRR